MMFRTLLLVLVGVSCSAVATAAPPYDVTVNLTAPTTGGPVDTYTLLVNGTESGTLNPGSNVLPGLITADGTYVFQVRATNVAGSTNSDPVTKSITEITMPGKPGIEISIDCSPCVITSN